MKPYKEWLDIEQNTPEWQDLRKGKIGGSTVKHIMAHYGTGKFGDPAHKIALNIALFELTGNWDDYNPDIKNYDRGHKEEPTIREMYEAETFCEVTNGGYYIVSDRIGCSPDGHPGDGLVEIKSRQYNVFFDAIKRKDVPSVDKWQIPFNLKCSGKPWIDYVEGCLAFPEGKQLLIVRKTPADYEKEFRQIDFRLAEFFKLIDDKKIEIEKFGR